MRLLPHIVTTLLSLLLTGWVGSSLLPSTSVASLRVRLSLEFPFRSQEDRGEEVTDVVTETRFFIYLVLNFILFQLSTYQLLIYLVN